MAAQNTKLKPGYKQTEIGAIPEDWEVKKLGEIAPLQRGFDLPTSHLKMGIYPVVYSNGVLNYHSSFKVKAPGVVTGRSGTIGKVNYIEDDYWPHNTSLWVTDFKGNLPKFIYYMYINIKLERFGTGSGVPTLNRNDVHSYQIPLPTLHEQRAIATALSDVDALISSLERLITKKRDIKQATMQQLLTGKMRLPGFSRELKSAYKQTEVGEIPEEWDVKKLRDLCIAIVDGTHYTPRYVKDGVPFYSVENITANNFTDTKYISLKEHNKLIRRYKLEKGDILLTRIGSLGYTKLVNWDVKASIYVSLALLKMNNQQILTGYIYEYSKSNQFVKDVEKRSLMNATPIKINMGQIGNIPIPCPPLPEQQAIAAILSDMDAEIAALEQKRDKTRALKQGMMQELLTGKTRLL